MKYLLIDNESE